MTSKQRKEIESTVQSIRVLSARLSAHLSELGMQIRPFNQGLAQQISEAKHQINNTICLPCNAVALLETKEEATNA